MTYQLSGFHSLLIQKTISVISPAQYLEHGWMILSGLPTPAIMIFLMITSAALYKSANVLPWFWQWQIEDTPEFLAQNPHVKPKHIGVYPRSIPLFLLILLTGVSIYLFRANIADQQPQLAQLGRANALLIAIFGQSIIYCAIMDFRERWLPYHCLGPLLIIGLYLHPLCQISDAINGMTVCSLFTLTFFICRIAIVMIRSKELNLTLISGGDILLSMVIGTWLGSVYGLLSVLFGLCLYCAVTPIRSLLIRMKKQHLLYYAGFDPRDYTLPMGPYMAAILIPMLFLIPDLYADNSVLLSNLDRQSAIMEASRKFHEKHPEISAKDAQNYLLRLEKEKNHIQPNAQK